MSDTRQMAFVTQPGVIEIWERPIPALGDQDVLIKVKATTLCGSDLHIFKGVHPSVSLPVPVGHEIAGDVAQIGPRVTKFKPGDRVTVEPVITCDHCQYCLRGQYHLCANVSFQYRQGQGGLTTDFVADERWVHKLPEGIPYTVGALIEPLAVALHAVGLSGLEIADSVAIFGAGAIGLLTLQVARAAGAGQILITDIRPARLEKAQALGASEAINSAQTDPIEVIQQKTQGLGVTRAFEAVGLEATLTQTLQSLQKGGRAVLVGLFESQTIQIPANIFVHKEISLTGSQGYHWDFQRAVELLRRGGINPRSLLTHYFSLEQAQQAFDIFQDRDQDAIKVVISNE